MHSSVRFRVFVPVGGFVNGRFAELCGRVTVDEDGAIHAEGTATAASADTGVSDRDRHLRRLGFLDVTANPQIDTAEGQATDGNVSSAPRSADPSFALVGIRAVPMQENRPSGGCAVPRPERSS